MIDKPAAGLFKIKGDFSLRGIPYSKAREMLPELLDDIIKGTWRIKRIVGELKDYARHQPTVLTDRVDVNEAVRSAVVLCHTFINQHTQRFHAAYAAKLPGIQGSSQRIEQVVINLLQNACEALQEPGTVTVRARRDDGCLVVQVADTGMGIPENFMPNLFQTFKTTKKRGLGLGLAYSKKTVEAHGGTISVFSTQGSGTTFSVTIPLKH